MAGVPVPAYQKFWVDKRASLKTAYKGLSATHPHAVPFMLKLFQVLCDIEDIDGLTPASVGESKEWAAIVNLAEGDHESYFAALCGTQLFSTLYGTYTVTLNELRSLVKVSNQAGQAMQVEGFKEVRRRKRHSTGEAAQTPKKVTTEQQAVELSTRNFFAPLRTALMDTDASDAQSSAEEAAEPKKTARPHPIILTCAANLMQMQKNLKSVARQNFELRNIKSATRVVTKDMVDYQAVRAHLQLFAELIALPQNAIRIKCYDFEWPMNSIYHFASLN
jgi:hypothetical protein